MHDPLPGLPSGSDGSVGGAQAGVGGNGHAVEGGPVLGVGRDRHPLIEAQARGVCLHDEQVDVGVTVAAAGQHHDEIGGRRELDMLLGAVQHEAVAVGAGGQLDAAGFVTPARLQPPDGGDGPARCDAAQQFGLLGRRPCLGDRRGGQHAAHEMGHRSQRAPQFLVDHNAVEEAHAGAAGALGDHEAAQAQLPETLPEISCYAVGVVLELPHSLQRREFGAQAPHHVAQHLLFLGEVEVQHHSLPGGRTIERPWPERPVSAANRSGKPSRRAVMAASPRLGAATDCRRPTSAGPLWPSRSCRRGRRPAAPGPARPTRSRSRRWARP